MRGESLLIDEDQLKGLIKKELVEEGYFQITKFSGSFEVEFMLHEEMRAKKKILKGKIEIKN